MANLCDIRISVDYWDHPKIVKLQRRLGLEACVAHQRLMFFARANKTNGVLTNMTNEDIAIAAKWNGDADDLVVTMVELRLLELLESKDIALHNWDWRNSWSFKADARKEGSQKAGKASGRARATDGKKTKTNGNPKPLNGSTKPLNGGPETVEPPPLPSPSSPSPPLPLPSPPESDGEDKLFSAVVELGVVDPLGFIRSLDHGIGVKGDVAVAAWRAMDPGVQARWIIGAAELAKTGGKGNPRRGDYLAGIIFNCIQNGESPDRELAARQASKTTTAKDEPPTPTPLSPNGRRKGFVMDDGHFRACIKRGEFVGPDWWTNWDEYAAKYPEALNV